MLARAPLRFLLVRAASGVLPAFAGLASLACSAEYEPPSVTVLDDGGAAVDSDEPRDASVGGDPDASVAEGDGAADADAAAHADAPIPPDDRTPDNRPLAPEVGAERDANLADAPDASSKPVDACVANPVDAQSPLTWTVGSNATCTPLDVQCPFTLNTAPGTYAIRAVGGCPNSASSPCTLPSMVTLWFAAGSEPAGTIVYDILPVSLEQDIHDLPAGKVVLKIDVLISPPGEIWWAQSGKVYATTDNGHVVLRFSNVDALEHWTSRGAPLFGYLICP